MTIPNVIRAGERDKLLEYIFDGAFLLVYKPVSWTSFDVVAKLRGRLKFLMGKRLKVGHAGTLDPLAEGLLIIAFGKATKQIESLMKQQKRYTGEIKLGAITASYDAEQEEEHIVETRCLGENELEGIRTRFTGEQDQYPPKFSAIKKNGKALYKYARNNEEVKIEPRKITIFDFSIEEAEQGKLCFDVTCSKGTYIRSLAHDIGQVTGMGGYLTKLVRTEIGAYSVENAWTIEALVTELNREELKTYVNSRQELN